MTASRISFNWTRAGRDMDDAPQGYNVGDYFRGGWALIEDAQHCSAEEAECLLQAAYRGNDEMCIGVWWSIEEEETAQ